MFKYEVIKMISPTCFGGVYMVKKLGSEECYAMHVALKDGNEEQRICTNVLLKLQSIQSPHFVKLLDHGKKAKAYNFIVITLGLKNLASLIDEKKKLSLQTAVAISKQLLNDVMDMHKVGILHRDIKISHILLGSSDDPHQVMRCGLGYSANTFNDGPAMIPSATEEGKEFLIGSLKTGSLAGLTGKEQYYKDDLESLFYVMCELLGAVLPWAGNTNLCQVVQFKEQLLAVEHGQMKSL